MEERKSSFWRVLAVVSVLLAGCVGAISAQSRHIRVELDGTKTLKEVLGENQNEVDSLTISGKLAAADFETLWEASFYGNLTGINLENADIENKEIPRNAFYSDAQLKGPDDWYPTSRARLCEDGEGISYIENWVIPIKLKYLRLPDDIEKIGFCAFADVLFNEVNIPKSLKIIEGSAFCGGSMINTKVLIIPEGVKELPKMCFASCQGPRRKVVLPDGIEIIGEESLEAMSIEEIELPDGLKELGDYALSFNDLKKIRIPESCTAIGEQVLRGNPYLKEVELPENMTVIPAKMFCFDSKLPSIVIPRNVKIIDHEAFYKCESLTEIVLPEGLEAIKYSAFYGCKLKSLYLPSSVKSLGRECFYGISCDIYVNCKEPPVCEVTDLSSPFHNYSNYSKELPNNVYIPVGTLEAYRSAPGWDRFVNFHETNNFPSSVADSVAADSQNDSHCYDLEGRQVSEPEKGKIYIKDGKKVIY